MDKAQSPSNATLQVEHSNLKVKVVNTPGEDRERYITFRCIPGASLRVYNSSFRGRERGSRGAVTRKRRSFIRHYKSNRFLSMAAPKSQFYASRNSRHLCVSLIF